MARDNGGIPVPHEKVFTRTHRTNKGKGPFVDDKSKKAFEIYTSKLKEKQSDQSYLLSTQGSCIYYPELWVEASGGPKNGRCYGFGNSYSENMTLSDNSSNNIVQVENDKYKDRLKDLENQQMEMNNNFERRVDEAVQNIVKNAISTALEMHGIYQGHQFSSGQFPSPRLYNSSGHFSAPGPGYFSAAAPGYYTSHGYFPVPSQHPHAQYQVESQAHASTQRQPFENRHSSDPQNTQS
ncbi:hypothetical protein KSP40_PGU012717 [Platanthera guangdongensis]|uniref:Uncharacterized protein n=1 Tax=Platanthera guangdongensis TaxID=2320717 RepID=A0ABR2M2V1_9ASPA